jgi:signal transduction histidine kinase
MREGLGKSFPQGSAREMLDKLMEGCQIIDFDWTYRYVNAVAASHGRRRREEFIGRKMWDLYPGIEQTKIFAALCQCMNQRAAVEMETEFEYPDGKLGLFELRMQPVPEGILVLSRNITKAKHRENLLQKANSTLRAIRDCHEAMLRAKTESELLNEICQIIVNTGGERMVWVGFAEHNARKSVRPVAEAGVRENYLARAHITWADTARGRGPVGTAIRTGKVTLCRDTQSDPRFAPWRREASRQGYGSAISLPLMVQKQCVGALSIYAPLRDAFDSEERRLLKHLADDLAFGISTLRLRAERERLEREILSSVEREQERFGRDLHDGLCQILVGAKFRSIYLEKILSKKFPAAAREARSLERLLTQAIDQSRDLSRGLNPVRVQTHGLIAALQELAVGVEKNSRVQCSCYVPRPVAVTRHDVATQLYRVAQEAVQNAVKHSKASFILISLTRNRSVIELSVKDNGIGISESHIKNSGSGLNNMRTRAEMLGARLEIRRRKSGGTAITCTLAIYSKSKQ